MSKVRITASDGHVYEIDAPDGMSDADIQRQFEAQMGGENAAPQPLTGQQIVDEIKGRMDKGEPDDAIRARVAELFPGDGADVAKIRSDADRALDYRRKYGKTPELAVGPSLGGTAEDDRPKSFFQGFVEGIEKPFNNAATWLENGLNNFRWTDKAHNLIGVNAGEGLADTIDRKGNELFGMAPSVDAARNNQAQQRAVSPYQSSAPGKFTGEVTGAVLASRLPGGALSKGAQAGALLTDNPNDPTAVATDAATGAVLGKVGQKVINGVAKVVAPVVTPAIRTLIDAGVKLTPGQVGRASGTRFGKMVGRMEDRATSRPFVGDDVIDARAQAGEDFGRATIDRVVAPIGSKLPDNIPVGRGAVKWAGNKLSDRFEELKPNLRVNGDDPNFIDGLGAISQETSTMLPARAEQFKNILGGLERFWRDQGTTLSGDAFKAVDERLGQNIRRFGSSQDADQQQVGTMLESVRELLYDTAANQNPAMASDLQALNQGWKSLTQVERAIGNSKAAITPNGYSQAVKMSSDTVRRRGYARGDALNQDLADAGSSVLPSELADSGTAQRSGGVWRSLIGAAQAPIYRGIQAVTPIATRNGSVSPELARLLRLASASAPYALPQIGQSVRN